jgi:hypothetical protein
MARFLVHGHLKDMPLGPSPLVTTSVRVSKPTQLQLSSKLVLVSAPGDVEHRSALIYSKPSPTGAAGASAGVGVGFGSHVTHKRLMYTISFRGGLEHAVLVPLSITATTHSGPVMVLPDLSPEKPVFVITSS